MLASTSGGKKYVTVTPERRVAGAPEGSQVRRVIGERRRSASSGRAELEVAAQAVAGVDEDTALAEPDLQSRRSNGVQDLRVEAGQPHGHALVGIAPLAIDHHLQRGILDVEDPTEVEDEHAGTVLGHQFSEPVADLLGVGEEEPAFGADDQQALDRFVVRVLGGKRSKQVLASLAANHAHPRVRGLARETQKRERDGSDDALQRAENEDAEECRQRPTEFHAADPADRRELEPLDRPAE